jgi:hypothetical protein
VGSCVKKLPRAREKNRRARGGIFLSFVLNALNIRIWLFALNDANVWKIY